MAGLEFGGGAGTPLWFNLNLLCLHPYLNIDLSAHCYVPAAKCLVEVVMEMYREGVTVDDVAVSQRWRRRQWRPSPLLLLLLTAAVTAAAHSSDVPSHPPWPSSAPCFSAGSALLLLLLTPPPWHFACPAGHAVPGQPAAGRQAAQPSGPGGALCSWAVCRRHCCRHCCSAGAATAAAAAATAAAANAAATALLAGLPAPPPPRLAMSPPDCLSPSCASPPSRMCCSAGWPLS